MKVTPLGRVPISEKVGAGVPVAVTVNVPGVPIEKVVLFKLLMTGALSSAKRTPLLATPETVTTTFPVVAPVGTGTEMLVALQLVGVAVVPLKLTVLEP